MLLTDSFQTAGRKDGEAEKNLADKYFCFLQETKETEVAKSLDITAEF